MALTQIERSGADWQARERGVGASSGYGYAIDELRAILRDHPPTGYDVYCSQDAPTFATWERVAWFENQGKARDGVVETGGLDFYEVELTGPMAWTVREDTYDDGVQCHRGRKIAKHRILPAGSPAPTEGGE